MSEHEDESQQVAPPEAPSEPVAAPEPETDAASAEETTAPAAESQEPAPDEPQEPPSPELAEPGIYWYDGEDAGIHPILGRLQPGENDFSQVTDPAMLAAIAAYVASGALEKMA